MKMEARLPGCLCASYPFMLPNLQHKRENRLDVFLMSLSLTHLCYYCLDDWLVCYNYVVFRNKLETWMDTLGMLVHGARGRPHPTVACWSHAHALHLTVARVVRQALLVHGIHWLK